MNVGYQTERKTLNLYYPITNLCLAVMPGQWIFWSLGANNMFVKNLFWICALNFFGNTCLKQYSNLNDGFCINLNLLLHYLVWIIWRISFPSLTSTESQLLFKIKVFFVLQNSQTQQKIAWIMMMFGTKFQLVGAVKVYFVD